MHLTKIDRLHEWCRNDSTGDRSASASLLIAMSVVMLIGARPTCPVVDDAAKQAAFPRTGPAPIDQEVCFSPDEPCALKLIKFVQSAKKSIDMAIYDINLKGLVDELVAASKRIPVRIIVDRTQSKGKRSLARFLRKQKVPVHFGLQLGIMHNKFVIIDRKMVEVGSFNFTNHASKSNSENQVYLASSLIVDRYVEKFECLWSGAKEK